MRRLREQQYRENFTSPTVRYGLGLWAFAVKRPWLYRLGNRFAIRALVMLGRRKGHIRSLPGAGGWTRHRDLAAPQGGTFMDLYDRRQREHDYENEPTSLHELGGFLFLTVILAPVLTFVLVGGYGFMIWMYQLVAGSPGAS